MKRALLLLVLCGATATSVLAADESSLAKAKNCLACHTVEHKVVGPAYKDVAAKYRGQKGEADKLAAKIMAGGSGAWGAVPMPANTQVNAAEAKRLAVWILGLK
ncbi:MAG: c-type cytochrome [Burkholderiaceae bacterium]|nr:c-type cytochrome [Burkholderiaceae bacterium]